MIIPLNEEDCIPDNFAGGGGATEGVEAGLQRKVTDAINHSADAIAMHKANHPHTRHHTEDIWKVDPLRVTDGRRVPFAWFSPDCTHFSRAKGGKPVDRKIRGLANIAVKWGKATDMNVFGLENVPEFQEWGPVDRETNMPIDSRKGEMFRRWWGKLEDLGYNIDMRLLTACDYGVPTSRRRLFIVGRNDGLPIVWPDETHGAGLQPYRTAADCIDWSIPCPSIFDRKRPLAEKTMRRIARGVMRYVVNNPRPFIVPLTHHGSDRVNSIDEPFRTITGAHRGELAVVAPFIVPSSIVKLKGTCRDGQAVDTPLHTIQSGGLHYGEVRAFLIKYYGTDQNPRLESPLGTLTTKDRFALVTVHGEQYVIVDIGMRMLTPRELFRAQGFRENYIIDPLVQDKRVKKREKLIPMPRTGQVKMCGNSVPPGVVQQIVAANCAPYLPMAGTL